MQVQIKFPYATAADIWTLAGAASIEAMGGPVVPWRPGREDVLTADNNIPENGRLPEADPSLGALHIREIFEQQMGFTEAETVALVVGGHSIGRCHIPSSGYLGPWTTTPELWSAAAYIPLLQAKDTAFNFVNHTTPRKSQFEHKTATLGGIPLMLLPADAVIMDDPAFAALVNGWSTDIAAFDRTFATAFSKLLELGVPHLGTISRRAMQAHQQQLAGAVTLSSAAPHAGRRELDPLIDPLVFRTIYSGPNTIVTDSGLTLGTRYDYRLTVHTFGGSAESDIVTYQPAAESCPNACSGHGTCTPTGICDCDATHSGIDCRKNAPPANVCFNGGRWCLNFFVDQSWLYAELVTSSAGWAGAMIDATGGMINGDAWVVHEVAGTGTFAATDMWSTGLFSPSDDAVNNLETISGSRTNGILRVKFRRRYFTGDKVNDRNITASGPQSLSWAHGSTYFQQHSATDRGRASVDWSTGSAAEESTDIPLTHYLFAGLVILGCALISKGLRMIRRTPVAAYILQHPVPLLPRKVCDLAVSEAGLIVIYVVTVIIFSVICKASLDKVQRPWQMVLGHVTTLHMILVLLPIARTSLWLWFFGIPFERAIRYHRWIALCTGVVMLIHLITILDLLGGDVAFSNKPTPYGSGVIYGILAFIGYGVMVILAYDWFRRKHFEVFFLPHHLYVLVVAMGMMHSTYYTIGALAPIGLYAIDRFVRFYRSNCRSVVVIDAQVLANTDAKDSARITRLTLDTRLHGESGGYCFVNIPQVSCIQWHPFSVSSLVESQEVTFHILDSGKGTFTNQLASIVASGKWDQRIKVDGPYGKIGLEMDDYKTIVMVAGGIGITPWSSVLAEILKEGKRAKGSTHLIWINRETRPFYTWFPKLMNQAHEAGVGLHFFATGKDKEMREMDGADAPKFKVTTGARPDMGKLLAQIASGGGKDVEEGEGFDKAVAAAGAQMAVLACGPAPLVASAETEAHARGHHFHKETFLL